jgi:hypothetical protein
VAKLCDPHNRGRRHEPATSPNAACPEDDLQQRDVGVDLVELRCRHCDSDPT